MDIKTKSLIYASIPAIIASCLVLFIARVDKSLFFMQTAAVIAMYIISIIGAPLLKKIDNEKLLYGGLAFSVLICLFPFLDLSGYPHRWITIGPLKIYASALVLPMALVSANNLLQRSKATALNASIFAVVIGIILALQPDASQSLAFSAGMIFILSKSKLPIPQRTGAVLLTMAVCALSFIKHDPLAPVPYVEGVFLLSFQYSIWAGIIVVTGVAAFVGMITKKLFSISRGLLSIPLYYTVLYCCSIAGLTPAPLVGFGAGPILGYAILLAVLTVYSHEA